VAQRATIVLIAFLLFFGTVLLYYPALRNGFVNYDDPAYVSSNFHLRQGLSAANIKWALTSTSEANWHPLTWISHMLDVQLFGLRPAGHHAQSIFWHAVNVVLLFLLLAYSTKFVSRSAVVAALFAVHPLNVESVVWVAERKTVLCTFFFLLTLAAYGRYRRRPGMARYLLVAVLFALALMAKPMAITLPFALLLIDFWPLERYPQTPLRTLVLEKIPLLALSAASAAITIYAQRAGGAVGSTILLPLSWRAKNAIYSYLIYIEKTAWPSRLAGFYPHPEASLALWKVLLAAAVFIGVSILFWRRRERRYLLVGWLWFLGTLFPMIGILQVGRQAWADRYAYVPLWGVFVIGVWLLSAAAMRFSLGPLARLAIAVAALLAYAAVTETQIGYWHDSYTLFSHALAVTRDNPIAEANLGSALVDLERPDLAVPHLERAIQLLPANASPYYNLGTLYLRENQLDRAREQFELALKYAADKHEAAQTHNNLGVLFNREGKQNEAFKEFSAAIALNPDEQNSFIGRGMIEREEGKFDAALGDLDAANKISSSALSYYWKGRVLEDEKQFQSAAEAYNAALKLAPQFADAAARLRGLASGKK
jgi:protein O-mannosyl-transferase